jgi:hypothetical protein
MKMLVEHPFLYHSQRVGVLYVDSWCEYNAQWKLTAVFNVSLEYLPPFQKSMSWICS